MHKLSLVVWIERKEDTTRLFLLMSATAAGVDTRVEDEN